MRLEQLDLDMERIALYIMYEVDQSEDVQDQQKLLVAEFGLLDSQVRAFWRCGLREAVLGVCGRGRSHRHSSFEQNLFLRTDSGCSIGGKTVAGGIFPLS